jgi:hypothetical protein
LIDTRPDGGVERSFGELSERALAEAEREYTLTRGAWARSLYWSDLLQSNRILIVSQAGSGKTFECRQRQRMLWADGQPAFFVELAELARTGIEDLLSSEETRRFDEWRASQSSVAIFFLDSYDELKLTQGSFRTALMKLANAINGQLARVCIVITSRPIPVDRRLVEEILPVPDVLVLRPSELEFADVAMNSAKKDEGSQSVKPWRTVELLPLSSDQIVQFATGQGVVDADALLADIRRRNATEFAERPQDLIELCSEWRDHHAVSSHRNQVANDIEVKLKPRTDRRERSELSPEKALDGASRLALAAILTRRLNFRHSAESDISGSPGTAWDPADILSDWTLEERATLLERPLFGFASYGRVRFHHRSVVEYLAARRLGHYLAAGTPISAVKRLLFSKTAQGDRVVRPTMRPVSAWLALENESIFAGVIERDPYVLLDFGDPDALTNPEKERALSAYIERYGSGGWRGQHVPAIQVRRFATPALATLIQGLWPSVENPEVRELLLDLIAVAKMRTCADIAFQVVVHQVEPAETRRAALRALAEIGDDRLEAVMRSLELDAALWPPEIARPAIIELFPEHMSVERLLSMLTRLAEPKDSVGYLTYHLPHRITDSRLDWAQLDALRRGLSGLVAEGVAWVQDWPHYKTARPFLLSALAAVCTRQVRNNHLTRDLASSIALTLRLTPHDMIGEQIKELRERIAAVDTASRELLFWVEDSFRQSDHPLTDPWERFWASTHHGPVNLNVEHDGEWIRAALKEQKRPVADRAMMLLACLGEIWDGIGLWRDYALRLRDEVADRVELVAMIDARLQPTKLNPEHEKLRAELAQQQKVREQQKASDHASWMTFWREIAEKPDLVFGPDRAENTVWNLWRAMSRSGEESRASGWNRRFLEKYFSKDVADRMRHALRSAWRNDMPTLRSERAPKMRNTFLVKWQLSLAAITAESEDPLWATKLAPEEAQLACRYAPIQLNGFPTWLDDLAQAHPPEVDSVLGEELTKELQATAEAESGDRLIQDVGHASQSLITFFTPRIRSWLAEYGDKTNGNDDVTAVTARLNRVLEVLLKKPDDSTTKHLRETALNRLRGGLGAPMAKVWLPILLKLDPEAGTSALESGLAGLSAGDGDPAVEWIASLFGYSHGEEFIPIDRPEFTPQLLLRLVRLSYRHVRTEDDLHHEAVFSPGIRDNAQHARNALLSAIFAAKGSEGWAVKLELANDPQFAYMRDRVLAVARELAAQEVDGEPMDARAVVVLERRGEAPPRTRDEMFQVVNDRLDDIDDLLLRDVSPREGWALYTDERVMRRAIALQLESRGNGAYSVDQEAVTADEKETDIRLRSTVSDQQGVIELKIGDKQRSAKDLREALSDQLVGKYMAADNCRAGCLLITVAKARNWNHPETGESLDLDGLITFLNAEASRIMDGHGGTVRVAARGLDLRPRLASERVRVSARKSSRTPTVPPRE